MDELERLGFHLTRTVDREKYNATITAAGLFLPSDYLLFLGRTLVEPVSLCYKFVPSASNDEWEGQVTEFADYSANPIELTAAIVRPSGRAMLPIASDAGGNWLLLNLDRNDPAVYDLASSSGALSAVAPTFSSFLRLLYREF